MNVDSIFQALQEGFARAGKSLWVQGDPEFAATLRLGQVLKGKVLRHFEGGRYLVSFGGQEKVVDSGVPLRTGEVLYGRVMALDDKVHLQRVSAAHDGAGGASESSPGAGQTPGKAPAGTVVDEVFAKYRATATAGEKAALLQLLRNSAKPELMLLSALVLSKNGLRINPQLVRAVFRVLDSATAPGPVDGQSLAPELTAQTAGPEDPTRTTVERLGADLYQALAAMEPDKSIRAELDLAKPDAAPAVGEPGSQGAPAGEGDLGDGDRERREWELGRLLLNAQNDGSVAHRFTTFPIWFEDRLVEVRVATFSQRDGNVTADGIRHRKLVFSLDTERLGRIELTVRAADRHLHLLVGAESESSVAALSRYLSDLKGALAEFGWQADEIEYMTLEKDEQGNVASAVLAHHITPDSLSRVM